MLFFKKENEIEIKKRDILAMIPVSVLTTAFYHWEVGLPNVKYPFNWVWGVIYFIFSFIFINVVFTGVFSIVGRKENPGVKDCIKTTAGVLVIFLIFVFLIETR